MYSSLRQSYKFIVLGSCIYKMLILKIRHNFYFFRAKVTMLCTKYTGGYIRYLTLNMGLVGTANNLNKI